MSQLQTYSHDARFSATHFLPSDSFSSGGVLPDELTDRQAAEWQALLAAEEKVDSALALQAERIRRDLGSGKLTPSEWACIMKRRDLEAKTRQDQLDQTRQLLKSRHRQERESCAQQLRLPDLTRQRV